MKNNLFKKGLVLIIILLFVGISVPVSSFKDNLQKNNKISHGLMGFSEKNWELYTKCDTSNGKYDLLIIAPSIFYGNLQKLVNHKNNIGIKTTLNTTEEIYNMYSSTGNDKAEKIKYFIQYAMEQWNISYVLLVGGLKNYFNCNPDDEDNWHVPCRYSHLDLDGFPEPKYLCDLYFADIYYNGTTNFCSWNNDPSGEVLEFGEWRWEGGDEIKDDRDLIPDVAVGRLPCRNKFEVKIMVDKIINYESSNHTNEAWFKRMLLLGGDSLDDTTSGDNGIIEGKFGNIKAYEWCKKRYDFMSIGLWPSETDPSKTDLTVRNFIREQNKGSGFTFLLGHGDWGSWFNHQYYANFQNWLIIRCIHLLLLRNGNKLPVVVIGGCNTASFDKDLIRGSICYTIECFSWMYARKLFGGGIATLGNTAICKSESGENYPDIYNGYLACRFFEIYGNGTDIIGDIWKQEITKYVQIYDASEDMLHCKAVENWVLLGDPSLRIGGYP
jgi:hypothetical protein